jgi:Erv1 / Alr family
MTNSSTRRHVRKYHFQSKDYSSKDGMLTTIWGPAIWHFLHCMSFNYPIHPTSQQKCKYMNIVKHLQYTLPCGKCRINLQKNFQELPLTIHTMTSRETFSKYIYHLHEKVNTMLGKTSGLSYEDVRDRYEHFRARCSSSTKTLKEHGCIVPFQGKKTKCILRIVDATLPCKTFAQHYGKHLLSTRKKTRKRVVK